MSRAMIIVGVLVAASGCGTKLIDPCAGKAGTCLAVQIDGSANITKISDASVHVTADGIDQTATVALDRGGNADLPVALAILFNNVDAPTTAHVDVIGLLAGATVGEGNNDATVTPGKHSTIHISLLSTGVGPDADLAGVEVDMASTDLNGYVPLTVQLSGSGTGTVSATGLTCSGSTCSGLYPPHTTVTAAAIPATNASFAGWSGAGCTGSAPTCSVTLDAATTLTATFDWRFVPSHVQATSYRTDAANLAGVTAIDTHNLTINGAAPPSGVTFAFQSGVAVMSVGQWNITAPITVTGDAPLVVVAAGAVTISSQNGQIRAGAQTTTPGPGGNSACATGSGISAMFGDDGGGGGGDYGGGASASFTLAGTTYGPLLADFCAGSKGGDGGYVNLGGDQTCKMKGVGGGGGGAVQISSAVSITLTGGANINAGGGGGAGGCVHSVAPPGMGSSHAYPGGGGSGGYIMLEAPVVSISGDANLSVGGLFANGGAGGSPYDGTPAAGGDGQPSLASAGGGSNGAGGKGGDGATSDGATITKATAPTPATSGGGGGGEGRIWIRTRGTVPTVTSGASVSPPPAIDKTL